MKSLFLYSLFFLWSGSVFSQRYISEKNKISFFSKAPLENIEAHTYKSISILDTETGEIVFSVPIKTFEFEKALMQEHFNENFMESGKYPRAKFKGKIVDFEMKAGKQQVVAEGKLEIHGVTKEVSISGDIEVSDQTVRVTAQFPVRVADHNIKIPRIVASNIAEVVDVTLDFNYVPHEEIQ
jgi:hypothetical protein